MATKWTREKIKQWICSQYWYQTIHVIDDIVTSGIFNASLRLKLLHLGDLGGKSVLDVGCNSGLHCFEAKKHGALKVTGIDIREDRLYQARILAEIKDLNIDFKKLDILKICELGQFDIVFCFSVVTEVPDLISSLLELKKVTKETLFLEMAISPFPNIPWTISKNFKLRRITGRCYLRKIRGHRWSLMANMQFIKALLGDKFNIIVLGKSSRYTMLKCDVKT